MVAGRSLSGLQEKVDIRFGKLGKTQGKPYCNSKAMGIHFPQPIFMSIFEKKLNFLAT